MGAYKQQRCPANSACARRYPSTHHHNVVKETDWKEERAGGAGGESMDMLPRLVRIGATRVALGRVEGTVRH